MVTAGARGGTDAWLSSGPDLPRRLPRPTLPAITPTSRTTEVLALLAADRRVKALQGTGGGGGGTAAGPPGKTTS